MGNSAKYIVYALILILLPFKASGVESDIDTLKRKLEEAPPPGKISILNELSREYWYISLDQSADYANQAYELAISLGDKQGIADALNRLGNAAYLMASYQEAHDYYMQSLNIRLEIGDTEGTLGSYNNLYLIYDFWGDREQALEYVEKALDLSHAAGKLSEVAHYSNILGSLRSDLHDFEAAENNIKKAFEIYESSGDKEGMARTLNNQGSMYNRMSLYDQAQECFFRALELFRETGNMTGLASVKNNIGIIHKHLNNNNIALDYFNLSLQLYQKHGIIRSSVAPLLNNIGIIWYEKGNHETALDYYNLALDTYESINSVRGVATVTHNIGILHTNMGNYQQAMRAYRRSVEINEGTGDIYRLANNYNNLGELYIYMKQYDSARILLDRSLEMALGLDARNIISENYLFQSKLFSNLNDFDNALRCYEEYDAYRDSIFSLESGNKIAELQIRNKRQNLITETELLQKNNEIQILEIRKQNTILLYLGGMALIITIFVIVMLRIYRYRRNLNKELKKKSMQLAIANKELVETENNLQKLNSTKDKFFSIIAHDLKNPFNALLGFSETLNRDYKDLSRKMIHTYIEIINKSATDLYQLLENLLEWSKSQTGNIKYNPEKFSLAEIAVNGINPVRVNAERKMITIKTEVDPEIMAYADKNIITTVIRNLVNNAVKFTHHKGEIIVSAREGTENIELSVSDNGIGIGPVEQKKLFSLHYNITTAGTNDEKGTGLGLVLCKEFVSKSGGEIWLKSEKGKGSTFTFTIPK